MTFTIPTETLAFCAGWVSGVVTVVVLLSLVWRADKRRSGVK